VRPTRWWVLAATVLGSLALVSAALPSLYGDLPPLPRYAPVSLVLLGLAEAITASAVRARARGRPSGRQLSPLTVARAAALAKASSIGGALVTGAYGGLAAYTISRWGQLSAARDDAVTSLLGVASALALTASALWLEWCCRTPKPPPPPEPRLPTPGLPGQRRPGPG
jgi:hypothetical protein